MKEKNYTFIQGFIDAIPVSIAYLAVAFTFGIMVVQNGFPEWYGLLISLTSFTSAGQFAGFSLVVISSSFFEIALTVFIINIRYSLMSLTLAQQLKIKTNTIQRLLMSFCITDEVFALAVLSKDKLNYKYFIGLGATPYLGWSIGTILGALINNILPTSLQIALGIALYCMFIGIIIPPARKDKAIVICIALAILFSCILNFVPFLSFITSGFRVIISSVLAACICAYFFPIKEEQEDVIDEKLEEESHDI